MLSLSYRSKLYVYSICIMLFITGTLLYSYYYVEKLIYREAEDHIGQVAQLSHHRLKDIRVSLSRDAEIVRNDQRLQEYMYADIRVSSEQEPLEKLYQRHFPWLPIERSIIISHKGEILLGRQNKDIVHKIQPLLQTNTSSSVYIETDGALGLVAFAPIRYRDTILGHIVLTDKIANDWLQAHHQQTGVLALFVKDHVIIASSIENMVGMPFSPDKNKLEYHDNSYHLSQLPIDTTANEIPQLWLAIKDTELISRLDQHRVTILGLGGTGVIAVLLLGLFLIRNFSRPLTELMQMTQEVANGKLPEVKKSSAKNEIAALSNQFSDMVMALKEKQTEIQKVHSALKKSAITDMLTGLYNRRYLQIIFPKLVAQAQRDGQHLAAIIIDIDHFKQINDTHGHVIGDTCLVHFADNLRKLSRVNDYLFRIGGEEFLILSIAESIEGIFNFADKLRHSVEHTPVQNDNTHITYTISCGISYTAPGDSKEADMTHMLSMADHALYEAKRNGRNRVRIATALLNPETKRIITT